MSAECHIHGCDLVYDGPDMVCQWCRYEDRIADLEARLAASEAAREQAERERDTATGQSVRFSNGAVQMMEERDAAIAARDKALRALEEIADECGPDHHQGCDCDAADTVFEIVTEFLDRLSSQEAPAVEGQG